MGEGGINKGAADKDDSDPETASTETANDLSSFDGDNSGDNSSSNNTNNIAELYDDFLVFSPVGAAREKLQIKQKKKEQRRRQRLRRQESESENNGNDGDAVFRSSSGTAQPLRPQTIYHDSLRNVADVEQQLPTPTSATRTPKARNSLTSKKDDRSETAANLNVSPSSFLPPPPL